MPQIKSQSLLLLFNRLVPLLAAILFAGVFGALFMLVIAPEIQKYRPGGQFDVEEKKKIVENRRLYLEDLKKLQALYEQYGEGEQSKLNMVLPSGPDIATIFSSYERFAKKMGVSLQSIDIVSQDGKVKNNPGAKEVLISLSFTNVDYAKLKILLKALETHARFTDVVSFDSSPDSQAAGINIRTYYSAE